MPSSPPMKSNLIPHFLILLLFPLVLLSCGARREVIALESGTTSSTQTDAVHTRTDTLLMRDSVLLIEKGDTVRIREVRYRDRIQRVTDTLRIVDTLRITSRVEVPVRSASSPLRSPLPFFGALCALLVLYIINRRKH